VLGVDPGAVSGWAILATLEPSVASLLDAGVAKTAADRARAIELAREVSCEAQGALPLVVVGERWTGRFRGHHAHQRTVAGLGGQWGRWQEALERVGHPKRRTLRAPLGEWRARVLGKSFVSKGDAKARAVAYARARWGVTLEHDAAEAACIAAWASQSPKVAEVLPKRLVEEWKRAHGLA
jgi:hypothetical protein